MVGAPENNNDERRRQTRMKIQVVKAHVNHLPALARNLRVSDRVELSAAMGENLLSALEVSYERSVACWCIEVDKNPIVIWGVAPMNSLLGTIGMPWMVGTNAMEEWKGFIGKKSRCFIDLMHYLFPLLINYVHGENALALRFLRWCGFVIDSTPLRVGSEIFFEARRTLCVE